MNRNLGTLLVLVFLVFSGCQPPAKSHLASLPSIKVVATTGIIAECLQQMLGPRAQVTALMGPGVDPHLYKASQKDIKALLEADVIIYNGLHLEGKMVEVLDRLKRQKHIMAVADGIPHHLIREAQPGQHDPHIWFDISLWAQGLGHIADTLARLDPTGAEGYRQGWTRYRAQLMQAHGQQAPILAQVPQARRVLITAHDAFGYYGRAYNIQVRGLQGISTLSEYGLADITGLTRFIIDRKVKAVFLESSIPPRALQSVIEGCQQQGHGLRMGGELFADALGAPGTPEGTYLGMVAHNTHTIATALK